MIEYLVFRLYGPMAAWGDIAVGEVRPTFMHPSKSAIMGLIAAALGIDRTDDEKHRALVENYGFAVQVNSVGTPLTDYHTVQVPSSGTGRNRQIFTTRRDEILSGPRQDLNTILSRRDYRMDASAIIVIWMKVPSFYTLTDFQKALCEPHYVLYLGRKSCPLSLPIQAQVVAADSVRDAINVAKFSPLDLPHTDSPALFWEEGAVSGLKEQNTFVRRDVTLSRKRWQFDVRNEHHSAISKEDNHVS